MKANRDRSSGAPGAQKAKSPAGAELFAYKIKTYLLEVCGELGDCWKFGWIYCHYGCFSGVIQRSVGGCWGIFGGVLWQGCGRNYAQQGKTAKDRGD